MLCIKWSNNFKSAGAMYLIEIIFKAVPENYQMYIKNTQKYQIALIMRTDFWIAYN